jgi:osmotically-inducible protein OsmY
MKDRAEVLDDVRETLASELRIDFAHHRIHLDYAGGTLTMEGEVDNMAAKKLALPCAAGLSSVTGIVDRLRVAPAQRMGDGEIADHPHDALVQEPALTKYVIRGSARGKAFELYRNPELACGVIDFVVAVGVVTLRGAVEGLDNKRLADVLAWWIPGSRDVINGLAVEPPEQDGDDKISDAVRLVLEKDPLVNASQIRLATHKAVVTLRGLVPSGRARHGRERCLVHFRG